MANEAKQPTGGNPNDMLDKGRFCRRVYNDRECGGVRTWEEQPKSGRRCLLCLDFKEEMPVLQETKRVEPFRK